MYTKSFIRKVGLFLISLLWFIVFCVLFSPVERSEASQTPFLVSPYYGNEIIVSFVDHEYPNTTANNIFTRYDGSRWVGNVSGDTCTVGVNCYDGHKGIDFGLNYETVLAAADGTVTNVEWDSDTSRLFGLGLFVRIAHTVNGVNYFTYYGHMSAVGVSVGDQVSAGQVIGTSGNTGSSTGAHLHFEIRDANEFAGELADICDSSNPGTPLEAPQVGDVFIVDDTTDNSGGFTKGWGGLNNNTCTGTGSQTSGCRNWSQSSTGYGRHTYYTDANGYTTPDNWAKWQPSGLYSGVYEIFVHIPSAVPNKTWQAKYTLKSASGATLAQPMIDQYGVPNNKWLSIGTYFLTNGANIYTTDATEEQQNTHCAIGNGWCDIAIDAVEFSRLNPVYLPHIREGSGWDTTVVVRNNGVGAAIANVSFFSSNGVYVCGALSATIPKNGTAAFNPCITGLSGIVSASQEVSVMVARSHTSPYVSAAYTGITNTSTQVRLPLVHRNNSGWYNNLIIMNTGTSATTASIYVNEVFQNSYLVSAKGRVDINTSSLPG